MGKLLDIFAWDKHHFPNLKCLRYVLKHLRFGKLNTDSIYLKSFKASENMSFIDGYNCKKILNHILYDKYLLNTFQMNIVFDKLIYFEYDA